MSEDATEPDVARLADDIERLVYGGDSEERAASRLEAYGVPREQIRQALRTYGERIGRIREVRDPRTLLANELRTGGWYAGPQPGDIYWPAFRSRLGFDEDALASVDNRSNRIVSLLSRSRRRRDQDPRLGPRPRTERENDELHVGDRQGRRRRISHVYRTVRDN